MYLLNVSNDTIEVASEPITINNRWNFNDINFSQAQFIWNLGTQFGEAAAVEQVTGLLDSTINSFSIFQSTSSYDKTYMLTDGRLYFFDEPITASYQRVLKDVNYSNYGSEGFSLNPDSFIQQSTINLEIHKLIDDILTLKNNIVGKFSGTYNNDILELDNYNYKLIYELQSKLVNFVQPDVDSSVQRSYTVGGIIEI